MFTGLVQDVGTVAAREGCRLTIATALPGLALGQPFIKIYSTEFKVFLKSARGIPRPLFF
jgi:NAD-dependent oxidoreductase involved in siderophore biosynthesis